MENKKANGKKVCLQRLRGNSVAKSLRFLEKEIQYKLFDFNSKKYDFYREGNHLFFKKIKKLDFIEQLNKQEKPLWISNTEFTKILKTSNDKDRLKLIDNAIEKYDVKTERYYNDLIRFSNKQNDFLKDKGQNILFNIEYLVSGKLSNGEELRFPFVLREIKKLNIDKNKKKIKFEKSDKYVANIPFITWLGNKENKEIESKIENIGFLDESNFIEKQLEIYSYLGIDLKIEDFNELGLSKELKLNRENRSLVDDLKTASHEAKHAIVLLHYDCYVESISINNCEDVVGSVSLFNDDEEHDYEAILDATIAPYLDEEEFNLENFKLNTLKASDQYIAGGSGCGYRRIARILEEIETLESDEDIEMFVLQSIIRTREILNKYDKQLSLLVKYLVKHKIMDSDEITEQFNSNDLIEGFNRLSVEMKLEKNSFQIERVELVGLFEHVIDHQIYKDTKKIFETNYVDNLLQQDSQNKNMVFEEDKITWSFDADISQQKAVFETLNFDKLLVQGPPGTGKTQTILNIISEYLSKGMKILVVSEKITAVEVIMDRFLRDGETIAPLILDLYNIENEGIKFYNRIGINFKKILNFIENNNEPTFTNMNSKSIQLSRLSGELETLDLQNKFHKIIDIKPSEQELITFKQIGINNIEKLKLIDEKLYLEFINWKDYAEKIKILIPTNLSKEIAHKLIELNKTTPYSNITWIIFVSILTTGNEKISFFKKRKFKKMTDQKIILDNLFMDVDKFEALKSFIAFDDKKYSIEEEEGFHEYKILIDNNLNLNRVKEISDYLNYMDSFETIKKNLFYLEPTVYSDINNKEMFAISQSFIMNKHSKNIKKIMERNKTAFQDIERLESRQVMNSKVKSFIKDNWRFVKEIFPVVLSTPELVSKYIPLENELYDLVIVDEASQFLLERSLPSLYRGKKIIISGDKQQLRPIISGQRFDSSSELEEFDDVDYKELIENESILDLFDYLHKENQVMLKTHYRSRKRQLINFSNKNFYEGKLNFLEDSDALNYNPISIINVEGKWEDQTNKVEALKIIDILNSNLIERPEKSIGVILFTKKQTNLIKKIIYKENKYPLIIKALESRESSSLFIKSLDQVQGEERDIIIFGITYGNQVRNYGYLSKRYGENRINVAITRSKTNMIIVKSYQHNEYRRVLSSSTNSRGPEILFEFLRYAENLNNDIYENPNNNNSESLTTNTLLKNKLEEMSISILKIIFINEKTIYVDNKNQAFYLIDVESLKNPREEIWFFEKMLLSKKYIPKGILLSDLF